ncbi:MAG: hybrid sensor histidine kinase/response regulator [Bacteroidales bacterium]|nr:hybrid sensor histidine kinase/response regulator [Bacteroidales bacterium]
MDSKQEAFLKELLGDFKIEAAEHHQAIINGLIELEQNPLSETSQSLIETTFRELHSLKGAARAVNLLDVERLCQSAESVFHLLKEQKISLSQEIFDVFHKVADTLQVMLSEVELKEKSIRSEAIKNLQRRLEKCTMSVRPTSVGLPTPPTFKSDETEPEIQHGPKPGIPVAEKSIDSGSVRIPTKKLNDLLNQTEELISAKATLNAHISDLRDIHSSDERLYKLYNDISQFQRSFSRMIDNLLVNIKTTLLYPFSTVLDMMPKLVRDLSHEQKKEIAFNILGKETEIDRRILEEIKDPLIHLIRNCIDHGLETPEERIKNGKPAKGSLSIFIIQETNQQVMILVSDDGAGIRKEKVLASAIKNGLISEEASGKLTEQEIFSLIFRSGISTSPFITDLSGRGLGMAIVSEKVVKLGGSISVDSTPGKGTTFTILVPLTLSTFQGIPVRVQDQLFIIPTNSVDSAISIKPEDIKTVEGAPSISLGGQMVGLVYMTDVLGIPYRKSKKEVDPTYPALVMGASLRRIAFVIDEVMGEQEGIVKDIAPILGKVRNISGVTILGSGKIVPVLNVPELFESAAQSSSGSSAKLLIERMAPEETKVQSILVAEDSITARSLIRNILETAGYVVQTAVDGQEALQLLKKQWFDLLVSDVEMPRLNGFELTARIREDNKLSELPVILVTALESADDRQRGMNAGANAYINKSSFEQNNLVETIHRLI